MFKTPHDLSYFDHLYEQNDDPWGYENRWYEARKRQICLSMLLKPMYQHGLEIGCSNGVFSRLLAKRCHQLTCLDGHAQAVQLAQQKLKDYPHVEVIQQHIPHQFPQGKYDLIVVSEILYYLTQDELEKTFEFIQDALTSEGLLLCCHWRYPIKGFEFDGDAVHQMLKQKLKLNHYLSCQDADFLVDVWSVETQSLAQAEGLI